MSELDISTQTFGEGGLLPRRRVDIAGKELNTPAKAIPAGKKRQKESLSQDSRRAAELYTQIDSGRLKEIRHDSDLSVLSRLNASKVQEDEMVFAFTSFQDGHTIAPVEARQMVNATEAAGDFITTPLQPALARNVEPDRGLADPAYQSYREGIEITLQEAKETHPKTPMMGVLPMLGQTYVENLLDLYLDYDVRAFCLNLDRKKITASRQVSLMGPLARYLTNRGLEEEVLIYAINLNPRDRELMSGVYPAANFAAVGLGVDVVGENHVPPRLPPEIFEKIESGTEEEEGVDESPEFRFFDKDSATFRELAVEVLPDHWPDDSALKVSRVMERSRAGSQGRNRMEALFNAEQMALAMQSLRHSLEVNKVHEYLEDQDGITSGVMDAFESVRESFDNGRSQSGLSEY